MDDHDSAHVRLVHDAVCDDGVFWRVSWLTIDDLGDQADYSIVFEKNNAEIVNQDRVNVLNIAISQEDNLIHTGRDR